MGCGWDSCDVQSVQITEQCHDDVKMDRFFNNVYRKMSNIMRFIVKIIVYKHCSSTALQNVLI